MVLRLGDRRHGSVGSEVFWSATDARLLAAVDCDGDGRFTGIRQNPLDFSVVASPEVRLVRLLGPTVVGLDEAFDLHLGVFDLNLRKREAPAAQGQNEPVRFAQGLNRACGPAGEGDVITPGEFLSLRLGHFRWAGILRKAMGGGKNGILKYCGA